MKKQTGITLIALVITILVLLILAGVALANITGQDSIIRNAENAVGQYSNSATNEQELLNSLEQLLIDKINGGNDIEIEEETQEPLVIASEWNGSVQTPYIMAGMTPMYWSTTSDGENPSTTEAGPIPIYARIDKDGNPSSTGQDNPNFNWDNWYSYVAGDNSTDTKTSRWANAVTDDGSYWVWIPRFKYKISEQPTEAATSNAGKIDVIFISTEEKSGATVGSSTYTTSKESFTVGEVTTYEFITKDQDGYIIHPAFEDGSEDGSKAQNQTDYVAYNNGEWDNELAGFWIAKYEMSMEDGNENAVVTEDLTVGNVPLSDSVKMVSKPGFASWQYIQIGQAYENCLSYGEDMNSHLIKNSE